MIARTVKLRDVLDVQNGFAFKKEFFSDSQGFPLIRIRDLAKDATDAFYTSDYRDEFLIQPGDYLIGMDGNFRCHKWAGPVALLNQRVCRLHKFTDQVLPEYVFYGIQRALNAIEATTAFVTVKHISAKQILDIEITLPPIHEQRRIIDLLSRADGIVRLRREAQKKAAELIPAIFLDMFGDPDANHRQFPVRRVSDFVARFEGGKNIQAGSEDPDGYRILKVSAVTSGRYIEAESKPTPDNYTPPSAHFVSQGDMLFSRANTIDLVGATAIVEATDGKTLLPDKLWRFVWAEVVDVRYMHALFQLPSVRKILGKLASGTSDSMRNISQAKLFALQLPIASLEQQRAFSRLSEYARSIMSQQANSLVAAEAAFKALLARNFMT